MHEKIRNIIRENSFSFQTLTQSFPELLSLQQVPQNPSYHAEGDVFCHTGMVCDTLKNLPAWQGLCPQEQELLFLAAAFHDIGKEVCTKKEDGQFVSPNHTLVGSKMFRSRAYREVERFGLTFDEREFVANMIRFHGLPVWFFQKARPEMELFRAAECIPLRLLYLLSKADVLGRQMPAGQVNELLEHVEWFAEYAKELGLFEGGYPFANPFTKSRFFLQDGLWQGAELYDSTKFDVVLLSGLPLAGKDHWILEHGGDTPVVSLDDIRQEMGIPPAKDSARVAHIGVTRAKALLAQRQPLIWNATNIVHETRGRLVKLFADYGARVHILYLEVPYQTLLARNCTRNRHIPEHVLEEMIKKLEVPAPWEAYEVKLPSSIHSTFGSLSKQAASSSSVGM